MMNNSSLDKAITEWVSQLGAEQVVQAPYLSVHTQATFETTQHICAILYPRNTHEVANCLKTANRHLVPIHVVSGGKNIGLGSSQAIVSNSVLMDLSAMNQIQDFDEEMAYITVEAGVTFEQVISFLSERKSSLMLDSIGSTGKATIVGNTAERGHGMGMYADRLLSVCGFEIVLPSGEIISTGFAAFGENNRNAPLAKWGVGASLDGFFTQSNFGVITSLTIWLKPQTDFFQTFIFELKDDEAIAGATEVWRNLKLKGINASLRIFSDTRFIALNRQYPFGEKWTEELRLSLREEVGLTGKWIAFGGIYSISAAHAAADRTIIANELKPFGEKMRFFDKESISHAKSEAEVNQINFFYEKSVLRGFVSDKPLEMCYWRKELPVSERTELHHDNCGVLWYCPAVPQRKHDILKVIEIIEKTSLKYDLEPNVGFLFISERVVDVTGAIFYDRDVSLADQNALSCHHEMMDLFIKEGFAPYRLGIQSMQFMQYLKPTNMNLLNQFKTLLDPNHILWEGRYLINV